MKNEKGFSFLEMSIVLAILGIFMLIGIPNYKALAEKAQKMSCDANRKLIEAQLENYYIDKQTYPTGTTDEILNKLVDENYLKNMPTCPSKGVFEILNNLESVSVTCSVHL